MSFASDPQERDAFLKLMREYFSRTAPVLQSQPTSISSPSTSALPPSSFLSKSSLRDRGDAIFDVQAAKYGPGLAKSALQNEAATSAAFSHAGVPKGLSNGLSKVASKHSDVLAPHLSNYAAGQIKKEIHGSTGGNSIVAKPLDAPVVTKMPSGRAGPQPPAGLTSGRSFGGIGMGSGKEFKKSVLSSKGPMSSEEVAKKKFEHENISLYVKPSPKIEKRAIALYDYQGTDSDDLSIREGEELIVVKHIDADWLKCKSLQTGEEGLVPALYVSIK